MIDGSRMAWNQGGFFPVYSCTDAVGRTYTVTCHDTWTSAAFADQRFNKLALIRWYTEDQRLSDVLTQHGCKKVRWGTDPISGSAEYYEVVKPAKPEAAQISGP